ncbi:MAG: hypothetical protein HRU19_31650 [Pseudobacteriovorax sp.]|nr:hypothetical protein [Pseudobacteriovorax sp.]
MSESKPLSIRAKQETRDFLKALASEDGRTDGDFLDHLLSWYQTQHSNGLSEMPSELAQVKAAMNRITDIFAGVHSSAKLLEDNLRTEFSAKLSEIETERTELATKLKESLELNKKQEKELLSLEEISEALKTLKGELENKNEEIESLKTQLGDSTAKLKELPEIRSKSTALEIRNAKVETENEQLRERLGEFRAMFKIEDGGGNET